MAKLFSVASWNVEHFGADATRVKRVVEFLVAQRPDVFGLFEVEGAAVFDQLVAQMPDYTFQITEGPQTQEILVGVRRTLTAFITQKVEFRSARPTCARASSSRSSRTSRTTACFSCTCRAATTPVEWV